MTPQARWPIQVFRIASLIVPSALAWQVAFSAPHPSRLTEAVTYALAPLWLLVAVALALRSAGALLRRRSGGEASEGRGSLLDRVDVLTASGSALAWLGAAAIVLSVWVGYASLAVVGLMGVALLHLVVVWTYVAVGGDRPWRRAVITRRFVPETVAEGEPVIEEVGFAGVHIPAGFRLFASGRVGPRWPTTRCVVEDAESGGEVLVENDVGPALRGDHRAEPFEMWLEDVLGLTRSPRRSKGEAKLTVLPRARPVDGARHLLGGDGRDLEPRPEQRLPTEGSLRLRAYQPGDDVRRIHWVRSLSAREVVVRLPDEVPPDRPAVRLVLDTFLPGTEQFSCPAPAELLDALVGVWLSVGRALLDEGARVTLLAAAPRDGGVALVRRRLTLGTQRAAQRLGAEARWQETLAVGALLGDEGEPAIVVSCRLQADPAGHAPRWIVVPEGVWTHYDEPLQTPSVGMLPHPVGSPENRWSRRRRDQLQRERSRRDHALFTRLCADKVEPLTGSLVARPSRARVLLEVIR